MTIDQLRYYAEVVQQQNFTKAAEKLFVSQSTLSKAIRALEAEFEVELINRASKQFALTAQGRTFYDYAVKLLDFYDVQKRELYQQLHGTCSTLNVGIPPTAGTAYFHSLLSEFGEKYPNVKLKIAEITSKSVCKLMENGALDIGVVLEPFTDSRYYKKKVYQSETVLLVSKQHHLATRKSIAFSELKSERFLMISPDYMFYDLTLNHCKTAGFVPNIAFESTQWDLLYEMVADNQGVSFLPTCLLEKYNQARVKQIHLKQPEFPWVLSVIYRKNKWITAPMQCFLDMCGEV